MTPRRIATLLTVTLTVAVSARAEGSPAPGADARVLGSFVMSGQVANALRVRGEHQGERVTRQWQFSDQGCTASVCRRLSLHRQRSAGRYSDVVLHRVGVGRYSGRGHFFAALRCRGRTYPRGELVPYRLTVTVTGTQAIEGIAFASGLSATYTNSARTDWTRCPIGPSHDAARYTGAVAALPSAPAAAFTDTLSPMTNTVTFTDTSALGAGGAPIVSRRWDFGDAASGAANVAHTATPSHRFTAPGVYVVTLAVIDANGLFSTVTRAVTPPGV